MQARLVPPSASASRPRRLADFLPRRVLEAKPLRTPFFRAYHSVTAACAGRFLAAHSHHGERASGGFHAPRRNAPRRPFTVARFATSRRSAHRNVALRATVHNQGEFL